MTKAIIRIRRWGFIGFNDLDSPTEDLAFQFKIYSGYASKSFATFVMFLAGGLKPLIYCQHLSKYFHTNIFTSQVILINLKTLETGLRNWLNDHQTLKLSIKPTDTDKKLVFCIKVVPLIIYQSDSYTSSATGRFITEDSITTS